MILARSKVTRDLFAIKVMDKEAMVNLNVDEFVMNERNILNKVDNDFVVRGILTFQSSKYLYMVMEYMKGGDIGTLLDRFGCFNFLTARFYLAQVVLALEHLHSRGIAHRDLKPENILIGVDGHIKLTDFGLSEAGLMTKISQGTNPSKTKFQISADEKKACKPMQRILGTADYIAPELIENKVVSVYLLDFWSLGVMAYEFLTGNLPFNSLKQEEIFLNVLNKEIHLP